MSNIPHFNLIVAVVVILILIFVPPIRRFVFGFLRVIIAIVAAFIAVAGISMLMNNETIYEKPGAKARLMRFLTEDTAATSEKGLGTATCKWPDQPAPSPAASPSPAAEKTPAPPKMAQNQQAAAPSASPTPASDEEEEDVYPELITRTFPGIQRQKLFDVSQQVVNSLGGWKIVKSDPREGTIDCIFTSRVIGAEDDVRITVTGKGDIEVCSRSDTERPGNTSIRGYFPGDFGANTGHIKQFYETIEPRMDAIYKEEQDKENAKKPHGGQ
jgi:hypothetical protein